MGNDIFVSLGVSLGLTLFLELSLCALLGYRSKRALLVAALANLLTNPPVVLGYILLTEKGIINGFSAAAILEAAAVTVEWLCYKYRLPQARRPFLLSLGLNAFSYFTGFVLHHI